MITKNDLNQGSLREELSWQFVYINCVKFFGKFSYPSRWFRYELLGLN